MEKYRRNVFRVSDAERILGRVVLVYVYFFRAVSTGAGFFGGIAGLQVSTGHGVDWLSNSIQGRINGSIRSWSRRLFEILGEASDTVATGHRVRWGRFFGLHIISNLNR